MSLSFPSRHCIILVVLTCLLVAIARPVTGEPVSQAPATRARTGEGRIWMSIIAESRHPARTVKVQAPYDRLTSPTEVLAAPLQAELRRQKIDLKAQVEQLRTRPLGERLEAVRFSVDGEEVKLVLEHLPVAAARPLATALQLQVREERTDGLRLEVALPLDQGKLLPTLLAGLAPAGGKAVAALEPLIQLPRLLEGVARGGPVELISIEEPGSRLILRTR